MQCFSVYYYMLFGFNRSFSTKGLMKPNNLKHVFRVGCLYDEGEMYSVCMMLREGECVCMTLRYI